MRTWLNKCGDRELFWMMLILIGLLVLGLNTFAVAATLGPSDWEPATVVAGKNIAPDVERTLESSACLVPNSTGDTIS